MSKIPPPDDPLACDIAIGLRAHSTPGTSKRLGLSNRVTRDDDVRHLAIKLADQLRRCGWRVDRS